MPAHRKGGKGHGGAVRHDNAQIAAAADIKRAGHMGQIGAVIGRHDKGM